MAQFLVTYDVERTTQNPHGKILSSASKYKWYTFAKDFRGEWKVLPNTTLVGHFDNLVDVQKKFYELIADVKSQCNGLLNLEKHFVCGADDYVFSSDEKFS